MEVHDAVGIAKEWVSRMYKDEQPTNIGLEEVDFDPSYDAWKITIGFSRPWDMARNPIAVLSGGAGSARVFKIVTVNDADGRVLSLKNREI